MPSTQDYRRDRDYARVALDSLNRELDAALTLRDAMRGSGEDGVKAAAAIVERDMIGTLSSDLEFAVSRAARAEDDSAAWDILDADGGDALADELETAIMERPLEVVVMREHDNGTGDVKPGGQFTIDVALSYGGPTVSVGMDRRGAIVYTTTAGPGGTEAVVKGDADRLDGVVTFLVLVSGVEV